LIATTCFTGFEATVVFSEEAKDPRRTIPRAVYASIAILAVFFAFTTWALSVGYGAENVQAAAASDPTGFVFALSDRYIGSTMTTILGFMLVSSLLALLLGFQNLVARYGFALARAGVLPAILRVADKKSGSPKFAAVAIGATVAVLILFMRLLGADLLTVIFSWLTALGTVCIIVGLILTTVAIVAFFHRTKLDSRIIPTRIAPIVAGLGFTLIGFTAVTNYESLLGGSGEVAAWLLLLIPAIAIAGWALASTRIKRGHHLDYATEL
jgi:amino acid transporter